MKPSTISRWECPECGGTLGHDCTLPPGARPALVQRTYIATDALLSDKAADAMAASRGDEAQCGVEEYGGCGGTHTTCYYRGKMTAAIQSVTLERGE